MVKIGPVKMFEYIALIKDHIVRKKYVISFMTVSPVLPAAGSVPLCRVPGYAPYPAEQKRETVIIVVSPCWSGPRSSNRDDISSGP